MSHLGGPPPPATAAAPAWLQGILAIAADAIIAVDESQLICFFNRGAEQIFGYRAEEVVGRPLDLLLPAKAVASHRELMRQFAAGPDTARMMASRQAIAGRRRDGTEFPAEASVSRVWQEGRTILAVILRDVSARRRAEEALKRSEESYRSLVDGAPYGIYRSSEDGRFLAVNPAVVTLLGYASAEEVLALDMGRDLYRDPVERARLVELHRSQRIIEAVEVEWLKRDGSPIVVRLSGRRLAGDGEASASFEMIAQDVTRQRRLEAKLQLAQKLESIGQLTGGLAHELNNHLTVVLANAEFLEATFPQTATEQRALLSDLRAAGTRGATVINQLLGFSRRQMLALQPVDLAGLITERKRALRRLLPETVELKIEVAEAPDVVRADPSALEQILVNLVTNARDAMPGGGVLRLHTRRAELDSDDGLAHGGAAPGSYVCLSVVDTGVGMNGSTRDRIFEPFFTTKSPGAGTGLGLAMVYGLVKQQGGFTEFSSEPGVGTTFRIFLPAVLEPARNGARRSGTVVECGGSETILLAEDEDGLRRAAQKVLGRFGYTVIPAADGEQALELYRAHEATIALVVSDMVMPKIGGRELYRRLRREGKTVPFLLTSGFTVRDVRESSELDPDLPFLPKPWTLTELASKVREVLDREVVPGGATGRS